MGKLETAKLLARAHKEVERQLRSVHLLKPMDDEDPNDPIKLLEVVEGTIERGIEPIAFTSDPSRGIHFPSVIVEVSPDEFQRLLEGNLDFGERDWEIGEELTA